MKMDDNKTKYREEDTEGMKEEKHGSMEERWSKEGDRESWIKEGVRVGGKRQMKAPVDKMNQSGFVYTF